MHYGDYPMIWLLSSDIGNSNQQLICNPDSVNPQSMTKEYVGEAMEIGEQILKICQKYIF